MWSDLLAAVSLMLVFEGMLPFLSPEAMRRAMRMMLAMDDRSLRITGLVSMLSGVLLLYLAR